MSSAAVAQIVGELLTGLMSAISLVLVAIITNRASKDRKKTESRAERRKQESMLSMQMVSATCALSLVTAKKVMGQHTNGDVEEALEKAVAAQEAYNKFVSEVAATACVKI